MDYLSLINWDDDRRTGVIETAPVVQDSAIPDCVNQVCEYQAFIDEYANRRYPSHYTAEAIIRDQCERHPIGVDKVLQEFSQDFKDIQHQLFSGAGLELAIRGFVIQQGYRPYSRLVETLTPEDYGMVDCTTCLLFNENQEYCKHPRFRGGKAILWRRCNGYRERY